MRLQARVKSSEKLRIARQILLSLPETILLMLSSIETPEAESSGPLPRYDSFMKTPLVEFPKQPLPQTPQQPMQWPRVQPPTVYVYERQEWEYRVVTKAPDEPALCVDDLNVLGRDGWELVGVVPLQTRVQLVFKRLKT